MLALVWLAAGLAASAEPSASARPSASAPTAASIVYVVRRNETLLEIAHRALEPVAAYRQVQRLNHIGDDRRIPIGFPLIVPRNLLKTRLILATVEAVSGPARVEVGQSGSGQGGSGHSGSGQSGSGLAVGRTLGEGAVILTGVNAFVRLGLPDGSHLAIPSNSKVALARLRAVALTGGVDREIRVLAGGLESQVTPMHDPSSRFVVVTPVAQSAVRGTEFQVAYDLTAGRAASSVLKGAVGVSAPRGEVVAHAGQGVVATAAGLKGPLALLPAPELDPASVVQSGDRLHVALRPVAGAVRYRVLLASDAKAETRLFETLADKPSADFPAVPDGVYYLRTSAISREGLEGLPRISPVTRVRGDLAIVGAGRGVDGQFEFRWSSPGDTPAVYRFALYRRDDREHPLLLRDDLSDSRIAVPALPPGEYVWTVFAFRTVGGRRMQIASDPQSLHVP